MRKRKVTNTVLGVIGILFIVALLLVPATQAKAETMKFTYTSQMTKLEFTMFPDTKGHAVGVFERRGVAIFENEVAAFELRGTFDYIKKQGPWEGYAQTTFKDGSTFMYKFQGASSNSADGTKLLKGKGEFIKGTGRFEGIKGQVSLNGRNITPYTKDKTKGDNWVEVTGTYTLSKK
jgi:hypothetical protein